MLLVATLLAASMHGLPADSLAGTWQIRGDVAGNPLSQLCTFTQTGAAVAGTCTSDAGEKQEVVGELRDGRLSFWHGGDYNGEALTIIYTIVSQAPTELKGTIDVRPFNVTGTFTAAPAQPKP